MVVIGSGLGNDVDVGPACTTQAGSIVAAVNLEFLNALLAEGKANAASVIIRFSAIDRHTVASAIAAIKRETASRGLHNPVVLAAGDMHRIADARREQRVGEIVAPVNRKLGDVLI